MPNPKVAVAILAAAMLCAVALSGYGLMLAAAMQPPALIEMPAPEISQRELISDHAILQELHEAHLVEKVAANDSKLSLLIELLVACLALLAGGVGLQQHNQKKIRRNQHTANNRVQELILAMPESCKGVCRLHDILPDSDLPEDVTGRQRWRNRLYKLLANEEGGGQ